MLCNGSKEEKSWQHIHFPKNLWHLSLWNQSLFFIWLWCSCFCNKKQITEQVMIGILFFFFKAETSIMLVQQEAKSAPPGLEIWHHIQQGQTDTRGLTMHLSPPYSQPQGASASVREGVSVWGTHRRTNTLTSHGSHKPKKMSTHSFKLTPRHTVLSLTANLLTTMGQQAPFFVLFHWAITITKLK